MPVTNAETKMSQSKTEGITSLHEYIRQACDKYADKIALEDCYSDIKMTFAEMDKEINLFAGGLQSLGVKKGDKVSLFSENNARWMIIDQAVLRAGAVDAVRGSSAPISELEYIIEQSDSVGVVLRDTALFEKLKDNLKKAKPKFVVIMFAEGLDATDSKFPLYSYADIIEKGKENKFKPVAITPDDDATLIYTSGTTNRPKGVLLTHRNLMSQPELLHQGIQAQAGDTLLCVLPIWHAYERGVEYYYFSRGCTLLYTNIKNIKSDMAKYHATYLVAVPRIWESIYANITNGVKNKSKLLNTLFNWSLKWSITNKKALRYLNKVNVHVKDYNLFGNLWNSFIYLMTMPAHNFAKGLFYEKLKDQIGINFKYCISGGGALHPAIADFFEAIELNLRVGYGLTETSPVITLNGREYPSVLYSAGKPLPTTEIKIVDPVTKEDLPYYTKGLVIVRGAQIMKGYYKNPEATAEVMLPDGWFITGDLGWMTYQKDVILTGRQKEIIVLSNGENVEPEPIEQACKESLYINQIMLVGQDRAVIGAIIVPAECAYKQFSSAATLTDAEKEKIHKKPEFKDFFKKEINAKMKSKSHFRSFERITKFDFISEEFTPMNGLLTQTAKVRRNLVAEKYAKLIEKMYK